MLNDFFSTVFTREDEKDTPVFSQFKIQLNPQKIATKGFSTDSGRF